MQYYYYSQYWYYCVAILTALAIFCYYAILIVFWSDDINIFFLNGFCIVFVTHWNLLHIN